MEKLFNFYKKISDKVDIPFLLFLVTISSNKIYLKVFALVLIFALRPKFNFFFHKKLPLFYPLIIILATLQFLFFGRDFSASHTIEFLTGVFYWLMCYAYMYQAYLSVKESSLLKIDATLITYTLLNFGFCALNYLHICFETHTLMPFMLGEGNAYGPSTGDHITGLFGSPSYINAMVNTLLAIYFIHQKKAGLFLLTTFCAMLSFANIVNLLFLGTLFIYLIFAGDNRKRIFIAAGFLLCFLMYFLISPENYNYVKKTIGLSVNNEKEIMPQVIVGEPIHNEQPVAAPEKLKYINDSSAANQKIMMADRSILFKNNFENYKTYYPVDITTSQGKKIAILQTVHFLKENPLCLFFGAGMGNFSSRLAFQFSGRDSSRLFMKLPRYCSGYYYKNNLLVYDVMINLPNEYHSIKHFPNNFFSQLLGEYGLTGACLFFVFYLFFFYKNSGDKKFIIIILFCISGYLMLDYLFEFFNVMLIFELLLFIDIKQKETARVAASNEK